MRSSGLGRSRWPSSPRSRSEELTCAVRLLLPRLSSTERAVFVSRETFGYRFREIAETLTISCANARQLGRRARAHLTGKERETVLPAEWDRLLSVVLGTAKVDDVADLERLLGR
jgi:sigma-70-like protein